MIRHFFIEGRFLGEASFIPDHWSRCSSYLFYCEDCGEVYAKLPAVDKQGTIQKWQSFCARCRRCTNVYPGASRIPGSIWIPWDKELILALPMPVLEWEYKRHLDFYLKKEM